MEGTDLVTRFDFAKDGVDGVWVYIMAASASIAIQKFTELDNKHGLWTMSSENGEVSGRVEVDEFGEVKSSLRRYKFSDPF